MNRKEAIKALENKGITVISCRMYRGFPKATISWLDFHKVREVEEVLDGKIIITTKMRVQ
jgi:hypothetical protein